MKLHKVFLAALLAAAFALFSCGDSKDCKDLCDGIDQEIEVCRAACDGVIL